MESKVVNLSNRAIVALETDLTHSNRRRVTADRRIAQVSQHHTIIAAKEEIVLVRIGRTRVVDQYVGQMEN